MTVPIIGISYKIKNQTTICKIRWINPCTGNQQTTFGIATCNPEDKFDEKIGQKLSESRAKVNMYRIYICYARTMSEKAQDKHYDLVVAELLHQNKIKPSKDNN